MSERICNANQNNLMSTSAAMALLKLEGIIQYTLFSGGSWGLHVVPVTSAKNEECFLNFFVLAAHPQTITWLGQSVVASASIMFSGCLVPVTPSKCRTAHLHAPSAR
jgi:hypothetical protein